MSVLARWNCRGWRNLFGAKRIILRVAIDLLRGRDPLLNQAPAILRQAAQSCARSRFAKLIAGTILQNHPANLVGRIHPFENTTPPVITRLPAISAAHRAEDFRLG